MKILSIDCGIKNFAYVIADTENPLKIIESATYNVVYDICDSCLTLPGCYKCGDFYLCENCKPEKGGRLLKGKKCGDVELIQHLINYLDTITSKHEIEYAIIEKQLSKNTKMKVFETTCYTYFYLANILVEYMRGQEKYKIQNKKIRKIFDEIGTKKYHRRKKAAKVVYEKIMKTKLKKADIADAYLQFLRYVELNYGKKIEDLSF